MIRELNFTNRGTMLDRFDAWLYMVGESGSSRKLWDVRVKLRPEGIAELQSELGFGDEWECWVEVYKSSRVERFKLGEGKLADRMDDRFATGFDSEVYPLLRIKLVATNDPMHKILASKDRINPVTIDAGGRREHLLPLRYEEIGQVPWYVREPGGNRPRLVVNANLHRPGETAEDLVKDKLFKALVLPEAYRQILRARLLGEVIDKDDLWLKFTAKLVVLDDISEESSQIDRQVVIEKAVQAFCEKNSMVETGDEAEDAE